MAAFDLFGLKKDLKASGGEGGGPVPEGDAGPGRLPTASGSGTPSHKGSVGRTLPKSAWAAFLALDAILILVCLGVVTWRVHALLTGPDTPPAPQVAKKTPPQKKPAPAEPKKAKEPPKKAEPKKKPPAKPKKAEPKKKPAAKAPPKKAPKSKAAAKPAKKQRTTRPVPFTYVNPNAKEVYLRGQFLVRSNGRKTMFKDSKGSWQTTVYLNIGHAYPYRFEIVDNQGRKTMTPRDTVDVFD